MTVKKIFPTVYEITSSKNPEVLLATAKSNILSIEQTSQYQYLVTFNKPVELTEWVQPTHYIQVEEVKSGI